MKSKTVQVRITAAELRTWRKHAKLNGLSLSAWIRAKCQGHVGDMFGRLTRIEAGNYVLHPWKVINKP